ncbi:MAG TPA: nucleoside recognition domain-containing protein [Bacillota bacterium]
MLGVLDVLSRWAVPLLIGLIPLYGLLRGVNIYEAFIEGAKEGLHLAARILPFMVSIFVAMGIFRGGGAMDVVVALLHPLLDRFGVPGEILPLAVIRPFSGGGALGITAELIRRFGPDSYIGRLASVMQGSTDTTFYILTFYFGSVGIKKTRHALAAGLAGDLVGFAASVVTVRWFFGY